MRDLLCGVDSEDAGWRNAGMVNPSTDSAGLGTSSPIAPSEDAMVLIADEFRIEWERDRKRREIWELEEYAAMLLTFWGRKSPQRGAGPARY